jgi:hypothetical protein
VTSLLLTFKDLSERNVYNIECRGIVGSVPVLFSGGPGFDSRPGNQLA